MDKNASKNAQGKRKADKAPPAGASAAAAAEIDAMFARVPKRARSHAAAPNAEERKERALPSRRTGSSGAAAAAAASAAAGAGAKPSRRGAAAGGDFFLDSGERIVPVSAPRRFQDGLPVFKSFDSFSDFAADAAAAGVKGGKCPFDCACCF